MKRSIAVTKPGNLSLHRTLLKIVNVDGEHTVPIEDLDVVVIDQESINLTAPLMGALGEAGVAVVFCGKTHLPSGIFIPYEGHTMMPRTFKLQVLASRPNQKRLWQTIIKAKIQSQARFLVERTGSDSGLYEQARAVFSGDSTNREGVAANVYWTALQGQAFVRLRQGEQSSYDPDGTMALSNALLNYGYAVLRACTARAIVLAGMHPAWGIHHHHRENTFSLADDLIEPLRVLVDRLAVAIIDKVDDPIATELNPALKRGMLQILTSTVGWDGAKWPLDAALEAYAAQVRDCLCGERSNLQIPTA